MPKNNTAHFRKIPILLMGLLALTVAATAWAGDRDIFGRRLAPAKTAQQAAPAAPGETGGSTVKLYLPIVMKNAPAPNIFGVTLQPIHANGGLNQLVETETAWTRSPFLNWAAIQPVQGGPMDWTASAIDTELLRAKNNNLTTIVAVSRSPSWAESIPNKPCSAPKPEALPALGEFMRQAVARYSKPPYNVIYWEIWNEPDVDPGLVPGDSPFGCLGNVNDPHYGGAYYAEMLKHVYPQMKAANPKVQILIGGLLVDCDPALAAQGQGCVSSHSSRFMEGILAGGGGPFFDGVSFHAYDYYGGSLGVYSNPNWSASNQNAPVMVAKANYIRGLLAQYGVHGKYLMNTEAALLCTTANYDCGPNFEPTKAYYVAQSYATALGEGYRANLWYYMAGWRGSGLLDGNGQKLPAFYAYQFAAQMLHNVHPVRMVNEYHGQGVHGYAFEGGGQNIWVLWSRNGSNVSVNLPSTPAAVYRTNGTSVTPADPLQVGIEPLYIQWNP